MQYIRTRIICIFRKRKFATFLFLTWIFYRCLKIIKVHQLFYKRLKNKIDKIICVKSFDDNSFYYKGLKIIKKSKISYSAYVFLKYFYFLLKWITTRLKFWCFLSDKILCLDCLNFILVFWFDNFFCSIINHWNFFFSLF